MKNIFEQLTDLLKRDERIVSQDGVLLKNLTQELARKNDSELIKLLLSDKTIKQHFFFEVEQTLIFDKEKFIRFVSNKQFLPDSYTAFKNKIGLTVGDEYVSENKEVVLVWPHKDCILEGGMTKEDQKRNEIFYNETLEPDEINRLLDAKVFTNFKRIDKKGEHKLDGFKRDEKGTIKDNLIIKGNNLLALASLKKEFTGKIKLIYIDPPYNTGNDGFKYNDNFNHSTWLTFMKNRLEVARQILRDDGVIFVQCDDNEQAYLKVLMDEVFGRENFINNIVWLNKEGGGKSDSKFFIKKEEYALCYAKKEKCLEINQRIMQEDSSYSCSDEHVKERGKYKLIKLNSFSIQYSKSLDYEIELPNGVKILPSENNKRGCWRWGKEQYSWGIKNNFIEFKNNERGKLWVYTKQYFKVDYQGKPITRSLPYLTRIDEFSSTTATKEQEKLFGEKLFSYPKPEGYLQKIIEISTRPSDFVLDYHLGSGTTAAVAHKMGRQYIGIEQMDYIETIAVERLKKVIAGELGGISEESDWKGGGDFVYCEFAKWNKGWIEKIEKAKTGKELTKFWAQMKKTAFLSYKIEPKTIDANAKEFADLSLVDQKKFLIECLDKNQLYINLSEIEDKEYGVSAEDKSLNKNFYNGK